MLKKLSKVYASVDNLKPVAQRERQAIIDTKNSNAMCYIIGHKCSLYSVQWYTERKQLILMDGYKLSVKTQSLLYGNSLDWASRP
jgi:hypothetical protein